MRLLLVLVSVGNAAFNVVLPTGWKHDHSNEGCSQLSNLQKGSSPAGIIYVVMHFPFKFAFTLVRNLEHTMTIMCWRSC